METGPKQLSSLDIDKEVRKMTSRLYKLKDPRAAIEAHEAIATQAAYLEAKYKERGIDAKKYRILCALKGASVDFADVIEDDFPDKEDSVLEFLKTLIEKYDK